MKTPALLTAAATAILLSSCVSSPSEANDHWSSNSIAPRVARVMLGYDPDFHESYKDYQWENKMAINKTMSRHLLNWNPDNPFQADEPAYYEPRPNHSPLPNPLTYFHVESVAIGAILFAAGGAFIPLPIDSLIGTLEDGGSEEFVAGLSATLRPLRVLTVSFLDDALNLPPAAGKANMANVSSHQVPPQ